MFTLWRAAPNGAHLTVSADVRLLSTHFTASRIPGRVGEDPSCTPRCVLKGGVRPRGLSGLKLSLIVDAVVS